MPIAFVLINTRLGAESEVVKKLLEIDGVEEAYTVYGVYDIVAKIVADDLDKLREIITWKIRRIDKILSTTTMVVMEGYKRERKK